MVCNKGFSTSSSLNTHKRIHSGEKPHQCLVCGKKFTASSNLYYHRMTHIKVKLQLRVISVTPTSQVNRKKYFISFFFYFFFFALDFISYKKKEKDKIKTAAFSERKSSRSRISYIHKIANECIHTVTFF